LAVIRRARWPGRCLPLRRRGPGHDEMEWRDIAGNRSEEQSAGDLAIEETF